MRHLSGFCAGLEIIIHGLAEGFPERPHVVRVKPDPTTDTCNPADEDSFLVVAVDAGRVTLVFIMLVTAGLRRLCRFLRVRRKRPDANSRPERSPPVQLSACRQAQCRRSLCLVSGLVLAGRGTTRSSGEALNSLDYPRLAPQGASALAGWACESSGRNTHGQHGARLGRDSVIGHGIRYQVFGTTGINSPADVDLMTLIPGYPCALAPRWSEQRIPCGRTSSARQLLTHPPGRR